jgi:hypothetical protein
MSRPNILEILLLYVYGITFFVMSEKIRNFYILLIKNVLSNHIIF